MKNIHNNLDSLKSCLDPYQFFSYVDGSIDHKEVEKFEKHLNSCPSCFLKMASLVRDVFSPATPDEKKALLNIKDLSQKEQVSRILTYQKQTHSYRRKIRILDPIWIFKNAIKNLRATFVINHPRYRPIRIMITMLLLCLTIYSGMRYFRIGYPIHQAQRLLKNNYQIYIENTRLSGGYRSTGISMLMSSEDKSSSYLERSKGYLIKAIQRGASSQTANHLLAQIYIIEKKFDKADSLLNNILNDSYSYHTASVYNDLGVLSARQKHLRKAADQFQSAIAIDNHFHEAYYNLALMKIELESTDEAISLLTAYIDFETNTSWKDAAEHLLDEVKRKGGT